MKKIVTLLSAVAFLAASQPTQALNYAPSHLLLVFTADGFSDFEIDLGPVNAFTGLAKGTKVPVTYDANAVKANFNNTLAGVHFSLVGATELGNATPRIWMSDLNLATVPKDMTLSKFSALRGKIDAVGAQAAAITSSNAAPYVVTSSDSSSFSYIVSGGTGASVGTMNGDSPFAIDAVYPTTAKFYELHPSSATTKPNGAFVGSFTIDGTGALYFTAGDLPPISATTLAITRTGSNSKVSFNTQTGANYRLLYTTDFVSGWTQSGNTIPGTGASVNITDSSTSPIRIYQVQTTY